MSTVDIDMSELSLTLIMQALIQIQQENHQIHQENSTLQSQLQQLQEIQETTHSLPSSSRDPKISLPDKFDGTQHKF